MNNLRSSQAFVRAPRQQAQVFSLISIQLSTNNFADKAEELFEQDWEFENEYHTMLDGKLNVIVPRDNY